MKKIICTIIAIISIVFVLSMSACTTKTETMYQQGIVVDGVFYEKSYQPMPAEVDESAIIGYVKSYIDTYPEEDGQTNISKDLVDAPYAKVEGGIALLYENEWYLCKPNEETTNGAPLAQAEPVAPEEELITFGDKVFKVSDLSQETIEWLQKYNELSEAERLAISGIPAELYELCGYLTMEDMEVTVNDEYPDIEAFMSQNLITGEEKILTADEGLLIVDILENTEWCDGAPACDNDYKVVINGEIFYYHSECGTFVDIVNNKSKSLSEENTKEVNRIISNY